MLNGPDADATSAYRKQHLNEVCQSSGLFVGRPSHPQPLFADLTMTPNPSKPQLLFPVPVMPPSTPSSWTVSDTSRRFPALARRKGQLPESILRHDQSPQSRRHRPQASRGATLEAMVGGLTPSASSLTVPTREAEEETASVQDFHKEDSRAILLPEFSGSDNAARYAGVTRMADVSFREDAPASNADKQQLLSSLSGFFDNEDGLRGPGRREGGPSARAEGERSTFAPATVQRGRKGAEMLMKVRVPGDRPYINSSVMPGYSFVRDLDSNLTADHAPLAFALNTSYMSLPSSRSETLQLASWTKKSLATLREGQDAQGRIPSGLDDLESLSALTEDTSIDWKGLPQAQVLSLAMTDMIRQVGAHCAERSVVLAYLWNEMVDLFENRTSRLEDVVSRYDAKMSVLMAEAPRLRQQSKLYDSMSKKASLEEEIAKDAKHQYKKANEDMAKMTARVSNVFARMNKVENYVDSRMRSIRWQKVTKVSVRSKKVTSAVNAKLKKRLSLDHIDSYDDLDLTGEEMLEIVEEKLRDHQERLKDFEEFAVKVAKKNTAIAHLKIAANISEDLQKAVDQMSIEKKNKTDLERKLNMFTSGNIQELEDQVCQSLLELSIPEVDKLLSSISADIGGGALGKLTPEQIAKILSSLPHARAGDLIGHMDVSVVAHASMHIEEKTRLKVFAQVVPETVSKILTHMTSLKDDQEFTLELASALVASVDDAKKVKLLEGYSNKHAVFSMERLAPLARVEVFNRINTESAIKLLIQSGKGTEQLASILSRCDEKVVSTILELMLNESNKNFDAKQKLFASQLLLEFEPEFAANVILCTASLTKKSWPEASTWTHVCSSTLDIDDAINVEGQCAKILLNIAQKNMHRAAEFLLKIRERSFAATLLRILLDNMSGQDHEAVGLALLDQVVSKMNIPIDTVSLIQLMSQDMKVNHIVATTAIDNAKFGADFAKNLMEKVPASLAVHFLSKSRIDAYNISCVLKHVKNEERLNEIVQGLDRTLKELVMRYLEEAKEKALKPKRPVRHESALIRRSSRVRSIEELRKNVKPAVHARRSMHARRSFLQEQREKGETNVSPPKVNLSSALSPGSRTSIFKEYLKKSEDPGDDAKKRTLDVAPVIRRRSKIGEELAKLADKKLETHEIEVVKRRESIKAQLPTAALAAAILTPTTPAAAAPPPAQTPAPVETPKPEPEPKEEEEAKESSVDTAPPNTTPFKTLAEMKTLQERFLGHHRRQWFANHDTRLKVALAQVSEAQSLQNKGPMSPNKSKVKSLLSLGKGRSGEWLNRMIDAVLNHLVEHHRQHTQHLNQQLTFMTSMVFLDHSLSSFHSEFMESFSTSVKVNCMAGSLRVAAWNMHEAFLGYFHKQYGTGTVVEEYMASMMVTLKQKLQDNAGRTATILNIIENEETPYMKNWKAMHRILWNMISNYWGGDVLARFVAALAAIDSFIQAENNKRSALNITSMNYEASSEWLCRRRAEIIADTVLGVRSVEAREIFEERITDISVPVEEDEKEMYLDIMENDLGGIVDDVTLEQYNQRHGDGEFCWKVLKAEFLYQLCLEARHYEVHLSDAILDIFRLCDKDNNGYMDQKEAEEMLEECIAMLELHQQIRRTSKDERLKYNLMDFNKVFKQFWVTAVLVDESSGSTPPSSMHVIERLVNEAKSMTTNPTLDWASDVEEISFTGFSAAVRMSTILRAYIQIFFTPPRENEVDLEDLDVFQGSDSMEDQSPQVQSRNSAVAVITKRHANMFQDQIGRLVSQTGTSEPILRGLLHRVKQESHGSSMIKMYLKLMQDLNSISVNKFRELAYGPITPPQGEEGEGGEDQLYKSFCPKFDASIKSAEYAMMLLSGESFGSLLREEAKILGRSARVSDLVRLTKDIQAVSSEVRSALVGIVVRKRLERTRKAEIKYTK